MQKDGVGLYIQGHGMERNWRELAREWSSCRGACSRGKRIEVIELEFPCYTRSRCELGCGNLIVRLAYFTGSVLGKKIGLLGDPVRLVASGNRTRISDVQAPPAIHWANDDFMI